MLTKEKVLQTMQDLPHEFSLEDIVERLILLEKIELGLLQVEEGKVYTTPEAKEKLRKWLR